MDESKSCVFWTVWEWVFPSFKWIVCSRYCRNTHWYMYSKHTKHKSLRRPYQKEPGEMPPPNMFSLMWWIPHCCTEMLQWRQPCQRPGMNNCRHRQAVGLAGFSNAISHQTSLYSCRSRASGGTNGKTMEVFGARAASSKAAFAQPLCFSHISSDRRLAEQSS